MGLVGALQIVFFIKSRPALPAEIPIEIALYVCGPTLGAMLLGCLPDMFLAPKDSRP